MPAILCKVEWKGCTKSKSVVKGFGTINNCKSVGTDVSVGKVVVVDWKGRTFGVDVVVKADSHRLKKAPFQIPVINVTIDGEMLIVKIICSCNYSNGCIINFTFLVVLNKKRSCT